MWALRWKTLCLQPMPKDWAAFLSVFSTEKNWLNCWEYRPTSVSWDSFHSAIPRPNKPADRRARLSMRSFIGKNGWESSSRAHRWLNRRILVLVTTDFNWNVADFKHAARFLLLSVYCLWE